MMNALLLAIKLPPKIRDDLFNYHLARLGLGLR
jgi:hypothetical protein